MLPGTGAQGAGDPQGRGVLQESSQGARAWAVEAPPRVLSGAGGATTAAGAPAPPAPTAEPLGCPRVLSASSTSPAPRSHPPAPAATQSCRASTHLLSPGPWDHPGEPLLSLRRTLSARTRPVSFRGAGGAQGLPPASPPPGPWSHARGNGTWPPTLPGCREGQGQQC